MSSYPPEWTAVKNVGAGSTFDKAAFTAFETIKAERDALSESDVVYKRKVIALEKDAENLLKSYQDIYNENKSLRGKVEYGPDATRMKNYRSEIKKLGDKVTTVKSENELLKEEIYRIQKQLGKSTHDKKRVDESFKMERGMHQDKLASLEKENNILEEKVAKYELKIEEYQNRIKGYENESEGLLSRYKQLKHVNIKMESKFNKTKCMLDEEVRDTLDLNKSMTKEIIQLKTKHAKLESDYSTLKLDHEAAHKQISYQNKELEVFKTQESALKRNIKVATREYDILKENLRSTEDMLYDARNFGFDAVFDERKSIKRKERLQLKRMNEIEEHTQELNSENKVLEHKSDEYRKQMEAAIMEREAALFKVNSLKRRIEVLENANIELDKKTNFGLNKPKTGFIAGMHDDIIINMEKEKYALVARIQDLELHNRRLTRKMKELNRVDEDEEFEENISLLSFRTTRNKRNDSIHDGMPSIRRNNSKTVTKTSKSLPEKHWPRLGDRH